MTCPIEDRALAKAIAQQIVSVGGKQVRRVVLIGSRAVGAARTVSDIDLVAIVELPTSEKWWGRKEAFDARNALYRKLPTFTPRLDLSVRTTDRFAEAYKVIGGVEWLAANQGIEVYAEQPHRRPVPHMTFDEVRRGLTVTWLLDASDALTAAIKHGNTAALQGLAGEEIRSNALAMKSVRCALYAVFVFHQVSSLKNDPLPSVLDRLSGLEQDLSELLADIANRDRISPMIAWRVLTQVAHTLARDSLIRRQAEPLLRSFRQPPLILLRQVKAP